MPQTGCEPEGHGPYFGGGSAQNHHEEGQGQLQAGDTLGTGGHPRQALRGQTKRHYQNHQRGKFTIACMCFQ